MYLNYLIIDNVLKMYNIIELILYKYLFNGNITYEIGIQIYFW